MAKIAVFGALLIALLAVAQATRLTVTTTITEQEEQQRPQQQEQCEEQLREQSLRLRSCQQLLLSPYEKQETGVQQTGSEHEKKECCVGLQNIRDHQCRCEAMREVVKDIERMERWAEKGRGPQQGHEQQMRQTLQNIRDAASRIPNQCNIGGPQECQIQQPSRFFF